MKQGVEYLIKRQQRLEGLQNENNELTWIMQKHLTAIMTQCMFQQKIPKPTGQKTTFASPSLRIKERSPKIRSRLININNYEIETPRFI